MARKPTNALITPKSEKKKSWLERSYRKYEVLDITQDYMKNSVDPARCPRDWLALTH